MEAQALLLLARLAKAPAPRAGQRMRQKEEITK
jgi:hypothetical protein